MDKNKVSYLFLGALAGIVSAGYLFDSTSENHRLMKERDELRAQLILALYPRSLTYARQGNASEPSKDVRPKLAPNRIGMVSFEETDEGEAILGTLQDRYSKGEYINVFENPRSLRRLHESIMNGAALMAEEHRTNLDTLFQKFGVPDITNQLLQVHVSKINEAAIELGAYTMQLQKARADYDKKVQSVLTPADYEEYKHYEASTSARREFQNILNDVSRTGHTLPEAEREDLISLIQEAKAYSEEDSIGPYGGLPSVVVGKENVLRNAEQRLDEIQRGANRAVELAKERSLSDASIEALSNYYDGEVKRRGHQIEELRDPLLEARLNAQGERRALEDRDTGLARGSHYQSHVVQRP